MALENLMALEKTQVNLSFSKDNSKNTKEKLESS